MLPKPELAIQSGEIAIPLVGGTVKIDGVAVTMTSNESSIRFEPDKRYLLMAKACADSTARLEQGEFDVFEVSSDDDLAAVSPADLPYMKEVLAFGNISQLAAHLDKERKGREAAREPLAR